MYWYGHVEVCCDMGWISAQRGVLCDWSVSKKTRSMYYCRTWSLWTLAITLLACIPLATYHYRFFSEPPMTTNEPMFWICCTISEPATLEKMQQTFSHMTKFSNSQVSVVTFSDFQMGWAGGLHVFFWDSINNEKYAWIILLKMTFLDFPR